MSGIGVAWPGPARPHRRVVVVTCFDARIDPRAALDYDLGDAHIFRNAGAVVTDDTLRSIALSQHLLDTVDVHLIAHTDCGLARFRDAEITALVENATGQAVDISWGAFVDLDEHVRAGAERIAQCPHLQTGSLRASVLDTATGVLRDVQIPADLGGLAR